MLRRAEATVLPQTAKEQPLKVSIAQDMKETAMQTVLPERTAPSQIIPSQSRYGDEGSHHLRTLSCFAENSLNFTRTVILFPAVRISASRQRFDKLSLNFRRTVTARAQHRDRLESVAEFYFRYAG